MARTNGISLVQQMPVTRNFDRPSVPTSVPCPPSRLTVVANPPSTSFTAIPAAERSAVSWSTLTVLRGGG